MEKHKIAVRWESDIYIVVDQPNPDVPVYVVKKEDDSGAKRTLHRNLLLPIGFLSGDHIPSVAVPLKGDSQSLCVG